MTRRVYVVESRRPGGEWTPGLSFSDERAAKLVALVQGQDDDVVARVVEYVPATREEEPC